MLNNAPKLCLSTRKRVAFFMSSTKYEGDEGFKTSWLGPVWDIAIVPMSHVTLAIIFLFDFLWKVCQNGPHFIFKNSVNGLLWLLTCFFLIHEVKNVILKIPNIKAFGFFTHIFNQKAPNLQICFKD